MVQRIRCPLLGSGLLPTAEPTRSIILSNRLRFGNGLGLNPDAKNRPLPLPASVIVERYLQIGTLGQG